MRVRENGDFDVRVFLTRPLDAPLMPVLGGSQGSLGGREGRWQALKVGEGIDGE